jgi:hypothetical protein
MPLPLSLPSSFHLAGKGGKNKKEKEKYPAKKKGGENKTKHKNKQANVMFVCVYSRNSELIGRVDCFYDE